MAWGVIHSPSDSVSVDAGGQYTEERGVNDSTTNYGSGRTALTYKHVFSKAAYFLQHGEYVHALESRFGHRANSETAVVAPVSAHISVKLTYIVRYVSKPPAGFGTTDRIATAGVQVAF